MDMRGFEVRFEDGTRYVGKDVLNETDTGWLEMPDKRISEMFFVTPWRRFGPIAGYAAYLFSVENRKDLVFGEDRISAVLIRGLRGDGKADVFRIDLLPRKSEVEKVKVNDGEKLIEVPIKEACRNWRPGR